MQKTWTRMHTVSPWENAICRPYFCSSKSHFTATHRVNELRNSYSKIPSCSFCVHLYALHAWQLRLRRCKSSSDARDAFKYLCAAYVAWCTVSTHGLKCIQNGQIKRWKLKINGPIVCACGCMCMVQVFVGAVHISASTCMSYCYTFHMIIRKP